MTRLGRRVIAFLLPLLLVGGFMELTLARYPNSHRVKRERLAALADEIDTLILGSSSAFSDVVPSHLEGSAFNLANVNQTLYYDDRLLTKVLPTLPRLKRVVMVVEYPSLFRQFRRGVIEDWRQYLYAQEWNIPPRVAAERWDLRIWSRLALAWPPFPWTALSGGWEAWETGVAPAIVPEIDPRGWEKLPGTGDMTDRRAESTLARHHEEMLESNLADNVGYVEHMFSLIQQRRIEGILMTVPVWATYRAGMKRDVWSRAVGIYRQLARDHGTRYLCFLEMPLDAKDFRNPDHLNELGAVRFSDALNRSLTSAAGADQCGTR